MLRLQLVQAAEGQLSAGGLRTLWEWRRRGSSAGRAALCLQGIKNVPNRLRVVIQRKRNEDDDEKVRVGLQSLSKCARWAECWEHLTGAGQELGKCADAWPPGGVCYLCRRRCTRW